MEEASLSCPIARHVSRHWRLASLLLAHMFAASACTPLEGVGRDEHTEGGAQPVVVDAAPADGSSLQTGEAGITLGDAASDGAASSSDAGTGMPTSSPAMVSEGGANAPDADLAPNDATAASSDAAITGDAAVLAACVGRASQIVCDGNVMVRCGAGGVAERREPCVNEARCRAGTAAGACASCEPGAIRCDAAELQECTDAGEFKLLERCASAPLCSAANRSCNPSGCGADSYRCDGDMLKRCKSDLTGFDQGIACAKAELCSATSKRCLQCVPNAKSCSGDTAVTCNAEGIGPTLTACTGTAPRCANGKCVQCTQSSDCIPTAECRVGACDLGTGTCSSSNAPRRTRCSKGFCDLLGDCQQCLDDSDCSLVQMCSSGQCAPRPPLVGSTGLLSGCSITLGAGYELDLGLHALLTDNAVVFSEGTTTVYTLVNPVVGKGRTLVFAEARVRTFSVKGPTGTSCQAAAVDTVKVKLTFTGGSASQFVEIYAYQR